MGLRQKKSLVDQATDYIDAARPHVEAAIESARDFVQDTALPALSDAKDKAAPIVAQGAALTAERAGAARQVAEAKVAQLKGEDPPKKGGKFKKFVLIAGLAGAVAFVAKKVQGGAATDNWQSSYTPTPAPAPAAAAPVDDAAGASPDEALSDAVEAPQPVTTPDEPAEVIDLDPEGSSKN